MSSTTHSVLTSPAAQCSWHCVASLAAAQLSDVPPSPSLLLAVHPVCTAPLSTDSSQYMYMYIYNVVQSCVRVYM